MSEIREQRPREDTPKVVGFERQAMVNWYDPGQLLNTAIKVMFSWAFGTYADKRELMPVLSGDSQDIREMIHDYSDQQELWLDYTADLGDGWDSTYTVASLLAKEELTLEGESLPRGRLLIMGGDEVYPTATRDEYHNRLQGPYRAALPWAEGDKIPHLYAIPGNHDWYDGLTSFLRLFCQGRWIGGWRTQQKRSYFAIKLPHNWWLWGLDVQLESDLDQPQIAYFSRVAKEAMQAGDKVILCTAEPSWVYAQLGNESAQRNLDFVEQNIVRELGKADVAVTIAGDLHHYCRYESEDGQSQKITSGGGGAFLHGTHNLPETLSKEALGDSQEYRRKGVYPEPKVSRGLLNRNIAFPAYNRSFSLFLGFVYVFYAWLMQSASASLDSQIPGASLLQSMASADSFTEVLKVVGLMHLYSPLTALMALGIVGALIALVEASPQQKWPRFVVGLVHGLAHILLLVIAMTLFAKLNLHLCGLAITSVWQVLLFGAEILATGFLFGGLLMGLHLIVSNRWFAMNRTNAMSALQIADYKNFLRMQVTDEGLKIHPIAVDRVSKAWRFKSDGRVDSPWFVPERGEIAIRPSEPAILVENNRRG